MQQSRSIQLAVIAFIVGTAAFSVAAEKPNVVIVIGVALVPREFFRELDLLAIKKVSIL